MIAASLARSEPEPATGVRVAGAGAAQVDDGGKILPLLQRSRDVAVALEDSRHLAIQERSGVFAYVQAIPLTTRSRSIGFRCIR